MNMDELNCIYDKLQLKYGDKSLKPIYGRGLTKSPKICFIFMNPTKRNIASEILWDGIRVPWIGTKNVWDLFYNINMLDKHIYHKIKTIKRTEWTPEFALEIYQNVIENRIYITNLSKCTQVDARPLSDSIHKKYLAYLEKEIEIIQPNVIILFGNQVSSVFLNEKISVSKCRKNMFNKKINKKIYKCYSVYYPVGNGRFNMDKAVLDIKYIMEKENIICEG